MRYSLLAPGRFNVCKFLSQSVGSPYFSASYCPDCPAGAYGPLDSAFFLASSQGSQVWPQAGRPFATCTHGRSGRFVLPGKWAVSRASWPTGQQLHDYVRPSQAQRRFLGGPAAGPACSCQLPFVTAVPFLSDDPYEDNTGVG